MPLDPTPTPEERALARAWWIVGALGLLSILAGIVVLARPGTSLVTLAVVTGVFLLVDGILEIAWAILDAGQNRGTVALFGAVSAIAGVILVRHPIRVVAVALLFGLWLVTAGIVRLIGTLEQPPGRLWPGALAALELIAGIVIVSTPGIGVSTLAFFVGLSFVLRGIGACGVAAALRALSRTVGDVRRDAVRAPA